MKVEVLIDKNIEEVKVVIHTNELTSEINELVETIESNEPLKIIGTTDDRKFLLNKKDIESFYTEDNKTYARIRENKYKISYKLYELEQLLAGTTFVRISNSEIVNFDNIDSFSYKDSTIYIYFKSGSYTYVSRRYIPKIKNYLKM